MPGPQSRIAGRVLSRLVACLVYLAPAAAPVAQGTELPGAPQAGSLSDAIPLGRRPANPLDIAVPRGEPPPRGDEANRVRDPGASSRALDDLRGDRLEDSTQRYRPALPSRRDERSVGARANRRLDDLRYFGRAGSRPGQPGF